jgi:glycosyltransferase involved in cell wall biosynthesis
MVKGVKLAGNVGHQYALTAGLITAKDMSDVTISIDADLQDDVDVIEEMIDKFHEGKDIVYGVRKKRKTDSFFKRTTAQGFYKFMKWMGAKTVYNHADFRLMSRRALDMLAGYEERNLYLRGLIPLIGLRWTTVDDVIGEREAGKSKYTLSKMLGLALDGITSFSVRPLYLIVYMGIFFLIVSLFIALYVIHALIAGTAVPGWSSLILSIWLVGGFVLIAIGIVGTYIGKIYMEVKGRPRYIISRRSWEPEPGRPTPDAPRGGDFAGMSAWPKGFDGKRAVRSGDAGSQEPDRLGEEGGEHA